MLNTFLPFAQFVFAASHAQHFSGLVFGSDCCFSSVAQFFAYQCCQIQIFVVFGIYRFAIWVSGKSLTTQLVFGLPNVLLWLGSVSRVTVWVDGLPCTALLAFKVCR